MVVLFFADIVGKPGRRAARAALPELKEKYRPDFILANVENLAGGRGVNRKTFNEMIEMGFQGFTSGNHIWDNREVLAILENDPRIFRPANYPSPNGVHCPGKGYGVLRSGEHSLMVINLLGRVFMDAVECPFATVDRILKENPFRGPVLVDMHCDATSEKYAMGWHLDGRVTAVVGSHSHVQTADERILPGGTAYITDVGMTGSFDSVIGMRPHEVIQRFLTKRPHGYVAAKENPGISCVVLEMDPLGRALGIERIRRSIKLDDTENDKDGD